METDGTPGGPARLGGAPGVLTPPLDHSSPALVEDGVGEGLGGVGRGARGLADLRPQARERRVGRGHRTPDPPHLSQRLIIPPGACRAAGARGTQAAAPARPRPARPWWELQALLYAPFQWRVPCSHPRPTAWWAEDQAGEGRVSHAQALCRSCWPRRQAAGDALERQRHG